jgi:hypothetical protein
MTNQYNPQEVEKTLRLICPDQVFEIRALNASLDGNRFKGIVFGYFNNIALAVQELRRIQAATGVYFTPNPVKPELLARAHNKLRMSKGDALTSDADILERRWWLIDIDTVKASGISATEEQRQRSQQVAKVVFDYLTQECGFPAPLCADSGNGFHLLLPLLDGVLDPAPYKAALYALAQRFNNADATIDQTVHNAGRIWKLYGTLVCKGDELPEQGILHRQSQLFDPPSSLVGLDHARLQHWLTTVTGVATPVANTQVQIVSRNLPAIDAANAFDWLDQWLARFFPEAGAPEPWEAVAGGRIWKFACPWVPEHGHKARITQHPTGGISAGCFGGRCRDQHWPQLRNLKEPDWRKQPITPSEPWPEPVPLPKPAIAPLNPLLIPAAFRPFLLDIAQRLQVPLDFPAVGLLTMAGSLIGRKVQVFPLQHGDWHEPANLWGLVVGPPGVKKTPSLLAALAFLLKAQAQEFQRVEPLKQQHEIEAKVQDAKVKGATRKLEEAIHKGDATKIKTAQTALEQLLQTPPVKPEPRRYYVQDSTVEQLQMILLNHPNGTLLFRDELAGLLKSLEKAGRETDRAFYLESWSGKHGMSIDRVGRGSHHIPAVCLSLVGTIQPGRLREYLQASLAGGAGDDGLVQRFQLMVCPDIEAYVHHDVVPDQLAAQRVTTLLAQLDAFQISTLLAGTCPYREKVGILGYGFSPVAQAHFDTWYTVLQNRIRASEGLNEALKAHLSKYGSLMAKLALIFHLIDVVAGRLQGAEAQAIQAENALRAIAWCEYLETHAAHLYGSVKNGAQVDTALKLLAKMKDGVLGQEFAVWEVIRKGWAGLKATKDVELALTLLEDLGWVRLQRCSDTGGRPSEKALVHPCLRELLRDAPAMATYPTAWLDQLTAQVAQPPLTVPLSSVDGTAEERSLADRQLMTGW